MWRLLLHHQGRAGLHHLVRVVDVRGGVGICIQVLLRRNLLDRHGRVGRLPRGVRVRHRLAHVSGRGVAVSRCWVAVVGDRISRRGVPLLGQVHLVLRVRSHGLHGCNGNGRGRCWKHRCLLYGCLLYGYLLHGYLLCRHLLRG